ncbi:MAG: DUF4342 domain-containing protein, partial [Chloroflexota bacterium]
MSENQQQPQDPMDDQDTIVEQVEVKGNELVDRVKELIEEGNVRRLIIRNAQDEVLMVLPLTATVVAGGAMLVFAPIIAAVGALGAFVAKLKLEIVQRRASHLLQQRLLSMGVPSGLHLVHCG